MQRPGLGVYPSPVLFGPPEMVADLLQEYEAVLGLTGVSLAVNPGGVSPEQVVRSLRLLSERVMPRFK